MQKPDNKQPKLEVGESTTYYGYPIHREGDTEFRVSIYADDLEAAQKVIKRCLEQGIIEWPIQASGRKKVI